MDIFKIIAGPIAELFCTAFLAFALRLSSSPLLGVPTALALGIFSAGPSSGGQLNPAVSFALALGAVNDHPIFRAVVFIVMQIGGAILGFGAGHLLAEEDILPPALDWNDEMLITRVFCYELLFTGSLVFSVLCAALGKRGEFFAPVYIGLNVFLGINVAGAISGAFFNPSLSIASCVFLGYWKFVGLYLGAQFAGGMLAVFAFRLMFPKLFQPRIMLPWKLASEEDEEMFHARREGKPPIPAIPKADVKGVALAVEVPKETVEKQTPVAATPVAATPVAGTASDEGVIII